MTLLVVATKSRKVSKIKSFFSTRNAKFVKVYVCNETWEKIRE